MNAKKQKGENHCCPECKRSIWEMVYDSLSEKVLRPPVRKKEEDESLEEFEEYMYRRQQYLKSRRERRFEAEQKINEFLRFYSSHVYYDKLIFEFLCPYCNGKNLVLYNGYEFKKRYDEFLFSLL